MVCKFCGNTIEDNSEFCFICGNKAIKDEIPAEEVFTQPQPAEIPVVTAEAPAVDTQAVYTQQAPIYAQQVYVQQIVEPKKAKKGKSSCSKAAKFFAALFAATFILQFIPWIWYKNAKKAEYEEKAISIINSIMVGLCIFMAVICGVLIKMFMLG